MKDKDTIVFVFSTIQRAQYWMEKTFEKFQEDVCSVKKFDMLIEFPEANYFFVRKDNFFRIKMLHPDFVYTEDDLYCILDDPEFHKLRGR